LSCGRAFEKKRERNYSKTFDFLFLESLQKATSVFSIRIIKTTVKRWRMRWGIVEACYICDEERVTDGDLQWNGSSKIPVDNPYAGRSVTKYTALARNTLAIEIPH
jgi:hypothetical protein